MDSRIFRAVPMGLDHLLLGRNLTDRVSYDAERNILFVNFEGFEVRTVEDVDRIRSEVERRCRVIGKPVALIASYDGFYLDPLVSDTYFSMIAYLEKRYYSSASRYTTSAFMRLKLGEALNERHVAPHIFETQAEAERFAKSQS
jgi:propionate CoA-transferase